jgi:hypothetical protein
MQPAAESISPAFRPTGPAEKALPPREIALRKPMPDRVPWEELAPDFLAAWGYPRGRWQPEHLEILGPTGSGKSFFEKTILAERARLRGSHIVIIATKPADATLKSLGWPIVTTWPPAKGWRDQRKVKQVIFWAKAKGLSRDGRLQQRQAIEDLLSQLWKPDSNIVVAFDEIAYVQHELDMRTTLETYFREGRGLGITVVASTQRPQGVTRYMHSESTWSVFFAPKDEEDAERMAQVAGNKLYYRRVFAELDRSRHEFCLVHNLTNEAVISFIPKGASRPVQNTGKESPRPIDRSVP